MFSTERNRNRESELQPDQKTLQEGERMEEKVYKTMNRIGTVNIIVGIITVLVGVTAGVMSIVGGAMLMKRKSDLLF